jgi:hypothetical protein
LNYRIKKGVTRQNALMTDDSDESCCSILNASRIPGIPGIPGISGLEFQIYDTVA